MLLEFPSREAFEGFYHSPAYQDWVLALGDADAPDLDLDPADLSSDPFYLDELAHDPLAFTSAAGARSLTAVLPQA